MEESDEFDVSLLDDLKPLESFLSPPEEPELSSLPSDVLELTSAEDFVITSTWSIHGRIHEIAPTAEPTAITSVGGRTAVGFRDGSIMIFNEKFEMETRIENAQVGAVTALGISVDGKRSKWKRIDNFS